MKKSFALIFTIVGSTVLLIVFVFGIIRISYPIKYLDEVNKYSKKYGLEVSFVLAVIKTESSFSKDAISSAGAVGLMQIMPYTAIWIASMTGKIDYEYEDLFKPEVNIEFGCFYLSYLKNQFESSDVVLCAYNLGETATRNMLIMGNDFESQIVEYTETNNFIKRVNKSESIYRMLV